LILLSSGFYFYTIIYYASHQYIKKNIKFDIVASIVFMFVLW